MQFTDKDGLTTKQAAANKSAQQNLIRGRYYRFTPPVTATAIPTGGLKTCALEECTFERGWYIGLVHGNHVFQGRPINDQRIIPAPPGYKTAPDQLRESYFHVLFIGGSVAVLDE